MAGNDFFLEKAPDRDYYFNVNAVVFAAAASVGSRRSHEKMAARVVGVFTARRVHVMQAFQRFVQ
jgi:hypothetical protein